MSRLSPEWRPATADVAGRAVVVGLVAGAPVAYLSIAAVAVRQSLVEGDGLATALRATLLSGEDWEVMPFWLLGAVLLGGVVGALAPVVGRAVRRRAPARPRLADVVAALVAAGLSALPAAASSLPVALCTSALVAVVALVATPRLFPRAGSGRP